MVRCPCSRAVTPATARLQQPASPTRLSSLRMSFLFATLTLMLASGTPVPLWSTQPIASSSETAQSSAPDTTQSASQPTLRECGLKLPPLQDTFRRAFYLDASPERRAMLNEVVAGVREVQQCYGDRRPRVVMSTYRALVTAQFEAGQPDASLRSYEEFFNRYPPESDSSMVSWMHSNRGRHHFLLGHPSRSLRDYARSVQVTPRADVERRIQRMNNLALTYIQLREWDTALHHLERVQQLAGRIEPASELVRLEQGRALAAQATVLQRKLREEAEKDSLLVRLEETSAQAFRLLRPLNRDIAIGPLLDRADGYLIADRTDEAAAVLQQARVLVDDGTSLNRRIVLARSEARLALKKNRMADARAHFDRVQELATRGGLIGHQRQAHTVNGQMDEHAGDLNAARRHYETSIALATAENESIRATLWSMHSFSDQRYGYDGLMRILRQQRNHAEAFEVWSQSRGRFLRDTRLQAALLNEMSAEVRLRYDTLTTQLNSLRTRRAASSNASDNALLEREAVLMTQRNELLYLSRYVPAASMNASAFDLNALHEAYQTLLAPLRPYLSDGDGLVIAPDGPLFQLPFSALVTAPPESRYAYRSAQYLIEERPVLSTLSPSLLLEDARAPERDTEVDIAAFGVSEFGGAPPPNDLLASEIRLRSSTDTPQSVRIHGSDATIVHLASHALLSSTDPLNSAFVLAPGESSDGLLRVHEIMQPGAQIPLVVLSGCSTARGELRSGEGLLSLQYAFQASGARSTLSHLWPTDDDTAVALSTAFYENLRSGLSKDVALQQAQRAFMEAHSDQRSPFFWASPVLFGAPNALTLTPARSRWIQVAWIAVGLAGIGRLLLLVQRYRTDTS